MKHDHQISDLWLEVNDPPNRILEAISTVVGQFARWSGWLVLAAIIAVSWPTSDKIAAEIGNAMLLGK
jgi:uncharacterized membrane protein